MSSSIFCREPENCEHCFLIVPSEIEDEDRVIGNHWKPEKMLTDVGYHKMADHLIKELDEVRRKAGEED